MRGGDYRFGVVVKCSAAQRRFALRLARRAVSGAGFGAGLQASSHQVRAWLLLVAASRKSGRV